MNHQSKPGRPYSRASKRNLPSDVLNTSTSDIAHPPRVQWPEEPVLAPAGTVVKRFSEDMDARVSRTFIVPFPERGNARFRRVYVVGLYLSGVHQPLRDLTLYQSGIEQALKVLKENAQ